MEGMDDFGDLYTDVDIHVNVGIGSFDHLYVEGYKNGSNQEGRLCSNSQKKEIDADPASNDIKISEDDVQSVGFDSKMPVSDADNGNVLVENGSDSDDELHILLNEEDCQAFPISQCTMNERKVEGSDEEEEDEDDDLVIVTESDGLNKDRKWVEPLQSSIDGVEKIMGGSAAERVNALKVGYLSQYSQFKYVRTHAAAFPSGMRTGEFGGVVSFPSPLSSRGDWDVHGGGLQMMSCSGLVASSCNFGFPAISQNGFGFSLPRNRTILDVGIDTFERKPWQQPGVDITDFFNFGLDEESWKDYCKSLENFRQQATMQAKKIPVYESLRSFQGYEGEFLDKIATSETASGEIAQTGLGERISSVTDNVSSGVRSYDIPKGRAILVGGGLGERRPSMDVRRPRQRDSDVVIQIAVHDRTEDSSVSGKEESKHLHHSSDNTDSEGCQRRQHLGSADGDIQLVDLVDESSGRCFETNTKCNSSSLDNNYHGDGVANVDNCRHQRTKEPVSEKKNEPQETGCDAKAGDKHNSYKEDIEAESAFDHQIQDSPSSPHHESNSEALKGGIPENMEKAYGCGAKPSSGSVTRMEEPIVSHSIGLRSDVSVTDDSKDDSQTQQCIRDECNYYNGERLRSVAESKICMDDGETSPRANRRGWYEGCCPGHGTQKKRPHDYDRGEEDLSYYRETEISFGYRGGEFAKKQIRRNTRLFCRKEDLHLREEVKPSVRRKRNAFLERSENESAEGEYYYREKRLSIIPYDKSKLRHSRRTAYTEEGHPWHGRNENDHWLRKEADCDDFVLEHRYRECFKEEKYGRPTPYHARDEVPIQEKYRRSVPHYARQEESIHEKYRRHARNFGGEVECLGNPKRYGCTLHFDADDSPRSVESDGRYWRHPDYRPLSSTYNDFHVVDGRGWHDDYPRNHAHNPWRSEERYGDSWGPPNFLDMQSGRKRKDAIIRSNNEHCHSSRGKGFDFDWDSDVAERRDVYPTSIVYDEEKRYNWHSWSDDEASFGYQEPDSLNDLEACFQYERISRHGNGYVNHGRAHGGKLFDDHHSHRARKNVIVERSDFEVSKRISSVSDTSDGRKRDMAALKCRESVNLHLNGLEGKHLQSFKTGNNRCSKKHGPTNHTVDMESAAFSHSDEVHKGKAVPLQNSEALSQWSHSISSKIEGLKPCSSENSAENGNKKWLECPVVQHQEDLVLEEGQLPSEELESKGTGAGVRKCAFEKTASTSFVEVRGPDTTEDKSPCKENAARESRVGGGYDSHRILETLAKMERRRERFKVPIASKKEPNKSAKQQPDPVVEAAEVHPQRPARKRRWGGN